MKKKYKRISLIIFVAVFLLSSVCTPAAAFADDEHAHDQRTFTAWTETGSLPADGGSYYLTGDVTLDSVWEVSGTVNLCLNGHSVTYAGSADSAVITVSKGNTLNLYDCADDPGSITGGKAGGIRVNAGSFNMHGGCVTGNNGGPGLYIEGGDSDFITSEITGGSFTENNNENGNGGAIYASTNVWVHMGKGVSITGNLARNGAGIYALNMAFVTGSGFVVQDNHASENGGGIFSGPDSACSSGAAIKDNTAGGKGGGVYLGFGGGSLESFSLEGAITGNRASQAGGGVYIENGTVELAGDIVISGNTAAGVRNNLYIGDLARVVSYNGIGGGALVGVSMETPGVFTEDYFTKPNNPDPASVFFSDKSGFTVRVTDDGKEAMLQTGEYFNITIADTEHGIVRASTYNAAAGATVDLTATPEQGYLFGSYTVTGNEGEIEVENDSFVMPACDVTVTAAFTQEEVVHVTSVSLDKTELSIVEGETGKLTATVEPEDALIKDVTWSTSDAGVATVSDDGTVTAVREGSAVITVTTEDGEKTATCAVTVTPPTFTVTFTDGAGITLETQEVPRGRDATAPADPEREGYTFQGWDKEFTNITADLTVNATWRSDEAVEYIDADENPLYRNEYTTVTADMDALSGGWYVVSGEVSTENWVKVSGNVDLILCDGAEYTVPMGINVPEGSALTIWCQEGKSGKLTSGGGIARQAGIGSSGGHNTAGTITINGGNITARGGQAAAGIGGGGNGSEGGTVIIKNGVVNAYGGPNLNNNEEGGGDGIGSGGDGYNIHDITITGGTVHAEGKDGGAGIGCTTNGPNATSKVTISGGTVEAVGNGGAGIGGQKYGYHGWTVSGGYVEITGGTVTAMSTAYSGAQSAAIGKGYSSGTTNIFEDGSLVLGDDRRVKAGTSEGSATYQQTDMRVSSTRYSNTYAHIDACPHDSWSYTVNGDTHIRHCDFCEMKDAEEPHHFNDEGVCTDCGAEVFVVSFNANGGSGSMTSVRIPGGETYTLPKCGFTAPAGKAFTGWDYIGAENQPPGTEVRMEHHLELSAHWEDMTWARLQSYIDNAAPGTTITLDRDLTATSSDTALTIPRDSRITLDLNGHILNRNLAGSSPVSGGSVIYIHPSNFTLKNGTLTGGSAPRGGGVLANEYFSTSQSQTFRLIDVNITKNTASEHGGGIYTEWAYGYVTGGSITDNHAWQRGGGVIADANNQRLYIDGTTITGNRAGTIGGGVFAEGHVIMNDVTITGNTCGGQEVSYEIHDSRPPYQVDRTVIFEGGGVFVSSSISLTVGGSTVITDNISTNGGNHANNAYLRDKGNRYYESDAWIHADQLTDTARIGITYEIKDPSPDDRTTFPVQVTFGLPGDGSLSNFTADEPGYLVGLNSDGEVILGKTNRRVILKPGDGQGLMQIKAVLINSQYRVPGKPDGFAAPEGLLFTGWMVEGTDTFYSEGQTIYDITQDVTLVAQWRTPWQSLQEQIDRAPSGAAIKLDRDYAAIAGDTTLVIPAGKTITIDLNGHTLDRAASGENVIDVGTGSGAGATLIIKDTGTEQSGAVTGGLTGVTVNGDSKFTLESGNITGNAESGTAVKANGTFTMSGGSISDNGSTGVDCTGTFTMSGGEIAGHSTGVALGPDSAINVSGTPKIAENDRNVLLPEGKTINVTARLWGGAAIGVSTAAELSNTYPEITVTSGLGLSSLSVFTSDDPALEIIRSSGNAALSIPAATAEVTPAAGLVYNGSPQPLATVSEVVGGAVLFAASADGPFTGTEVTGTNADRYTFWYIIKGDDGHRDSTVRGPERVTISKATPDIGEVTANDVFGSLDAANVELTRSDETIPGTLTLDETSLTEGTNTYHWTFTPEDTANYNTATGTVEITASEHDWGEPVWTWAEDFSTATVTFTCKDDATHTETVSATIASATTDPTCTAAGSIVYTATAAFIGKPYTDIRTIEIPATGHTPGEPATENTVAPTCTEAGHHDSVVYCTVCGAELSRDTVTDAALGHDWGEPVWTWAEDFSTATAKFTCKHDAAHTETVNAVIASATTDPTCTAAGSTVYTATAEFGDEQYTDTKTKALPATGHTPGEPVTENTVAPTCTEAGHHDNVVYCSVCNAELTRETVTDGAALGHAWGEPAWTWAEDFSTASAVFTCTRDGSHTKTVSADVTVQTTPAACVEGGSAVYTAAAVLEGHTYTDSRTKVIPATGHTPGEPVTENTVAPTCTEAGHHDNVVYCSVCNAELSRETVTDGAALGHDYGAPVWTWAEDFSAATVTFTCKRDATHVETISAAITSVTTDPTCTAAGSIVYTATAELNGKPYTDSKTKEIPATGHTPGETVVEGAAAPTCTEAGHHDEVVYCTVCKTELSRKTVTDGAALGHDWSEPVWTWAEDFSTAAATFTCKHDATHTETVSGTISAAMTDPTCTTAGLTTYTATAEFNGEAYTDSKTKDIPATGHTPGEAVTENTVAATCTEAGHHDSVVYCTICKAELSRETVTDGAALGHDYGELVWTWAEDFSTAKVTFTCKNDATHVETISAAITSVTTDPTCTAAGLTTYTATAEFGDEEYTDTKTKELPATGHTPGEPVIENAVAPTCTEAGHHDEVVYCKVCNAELSRTTEIESALGHSWSEPVWTWSEFYSTATATFTCGHDASHTETVEATITVTGTETETIYTATVTGPDGEEYTDTKTEYKDVPAEAEVIRLAGKQRYDTSILSAKELLKRSGAEKFDAVVLTTGVNFPDALAGAYLAAQNDAPVLLINQTSADKIAAYINENLSSDGTVYILGGTGAVPDEWLSGIKAGSFERLAGSNRYITDLEILKEVGYSGGTILVCTGTDYADSLSASGVNAPILLVGTSLTADQKEYLKGISGAEFLIVGGTGAVSKSIEAELAGYGTVAGRFGGKNRYETSVMLAEGFFGTPEYAVLAYSMNFPDGLSGGPLASELGAPIILTRTATPEQAKDYAGARHIRSGYVLGGPTLISDDTVKAIFRNDVIVLAE